MPPKPKVTKDEIAAVALKIIKENGITALTARELGRKLGTSASPIFTFFSNMDEVKLAARDIALEEFNEYTSDYEEYTPAFKRIGMMMVSYGIHEPELFKLLFMQEHQEKQSIESSLRDLGPVADACRSLIQRDYNMTEEEANLLFEQMWIQAYGLGSLAAMGVCDFSEEEIGRRLGVMFAGLMTLIKSGKMPQVYADVVKNPGVKFHGREVGDIPYVLEESK